MSAERLIRLKVTLPEGVKVLTECFEHAKARSLFDDRLFDQLGTAIGRAARRSSRIAQEVTSNAPIELTLEVPSDKRLFVVKLLKDLAAELDEA